MWVFLKEENEKDLYQCLNGLRILKQSGELDTDEKFACQTLKWRNILEYHILEDCIMFYSERCRLTTLAVLVESKKSTLCFTHMELDLILLFIKFNLCEKMEYIPFIKKALKRLKDSLAVMQRQLAQEEKMRNRYKGQDMAPETCKSALTLSYQTSKQIEQDVKNYTTFFINLREICVNNLKPDATYNRRRSSLQILLLMEDLHNEFKDIDWSQEQAHKILECLMLDTYESNKEMVYQILKSINPPSLFLDSMPDMIKIAFEFGNSIRPIDSVTAAYMLKVSSLSPIKKKNSFIHCCSGEDNVTNAEIYLVLMLYEKLQEALTLAKQNIGMVIAKHSLYGYLFCMRSLLIGIDFRSIKMDNFWRNMIADIISLCFKLSNTVSGVVINSSPEGYLPVDLERTLNFNNDASLPEKKIITSQMILLCSWRTVKEVSQLFGLLATKASIESNECAGLLTKKHIEYMMKHLVLLLCETKHRGAFEQVYVGFHQLCTRLWQVNTTLNILLTHCLHDILIGITGLMPGYSTICTTRRSAGIPFVIQAVLSSEPKMHNSKYNPKSAFHSVMKILLQFLTLDKTHDDIYLRQIIHFTIYNNNIFSEYEHLTKPIIENINDNRDIKLDILKAHSMNILRALFRHSQFGDMVKDYIECGLKGAFMNLNSNTWAERNAATLLFSALIVRIFGVQRTKDHINLTTDNKMTGEIFFERYPSVLYFILNELESFVSTADDVIKSNIQAILLLLSRLYISKTEIQFPNREFNSWKINDLVNFVSQCAKSPVHKTRELAARALVPLLTEEMAYKVVKKLFLILCTAQDTGIPANLIHGYLLQILEILTKLSNVPAQKLKSEITAFLSMTDWILKELERGTNGSSTCFLIAAIYVDILQALYNLDKNIIGSSNLENILHILQQHLIKKDLLISGPGEQIYKISIIKFMLCVGKCSNFWQAMHNEQSKAFNIYSQLLIMPEIDIQIIAWTTVIEILKKESCQQRKLLNTYAIRAATNVAEDLFKCHPQLQDAIFDFLYHNLDFISQMDVNECCITDKYEICSLVLKKLHLHDTSSIYSQRISYLRLLGKCMVTLNHELKDEELKMEHIKNIYKKVCDSNWIGSLHKDFRSSVFVMLYDLFNKNDFDTEHCHPMLDWWTMLLQLLVDDNADIRHEASILICKIEPRSRLECFERILITFFQKFNKIIADKYPEIAISAFFCWSVSLLKNTDYEMDETDVFNKCRNYDIFEPLKISQYCFDATKSIMERYSIDSVLPSDVVSWINYRLDTDFSASLSFRDIVRKYKDNLPIISREPTELLDPTFKDKLLQVQTYEKYMSL